MTVMRMFEVLSVFIQTAERAGKAVSFLSVAQVCTGLTPEECAPWEGRREER